MKTKNRVLLSAGMLFALTGVTLGASTYAWFTGTKTVDTSLGSIQAILPKSLSIDEEGPVVIGKLTDVSSADGKDFYKGIYDSEGTNFQVVEHVAQSSTEGSNIYRHLETFKISMDAWDAETYDAPTVYLSGIAITDDGTEGKENKLADALRVAVFAGDATAYKSGSDTAKAIYNNQEGDTKALENTSDKTPAGSATVSSIITSDNLSTKLAENDNYGIELGNLNDSSHDLSVTVVVWLEGTNASCTTENITETAKATVSLSFTAKDNLKAA